MATSTDYLWTNQAEIGHMESKYLGEHYQLRLGVEMCHLVLATHTGSSYGCLKLIKGPTVLKFEWLLTCFMLKLAWQHRVYAASIYIYIYIYIYTSSIYTRSLYLALPGQCEYMGNH